MNQCPCCEQNSIDISPLGRFKRPRLFNWITILLVSAWVVVVASIAEYATTDVPLNADAMIESLVR